MKRTLCLILSLLLSLSLLACGGRVVSSGMGASAGAEKPAADAAQQQPGSDGAESAEAAPETPEPTVTPEPSPTPLPTPPPVTQDVALDKHVFSTQNILVRITQLTYAVNYEVGVTYEIKNNAAFDVDMSLYLNSANCWTLYQSTEYVPGGAEESRYDNDLELAAGEALTVTLYYPMLDPAIPLMEIGQIDHFSVEIAAYRMDNYDHIDTSLTYVEVTGVPEPDFAYPAGETLYEDKSLTVTYLDFDAGRNLLYLYFAYPNTKTDGYMELFPVVNGVVCGDKPFYINTDYNKQAILAMDLTKGMELLGMDAVGSLSLGVILTPGPVKPMVLPVPIPAGKPAAEIDHGTEVSRNSDLVVRFVGLEDGEGEYDTQKLVFEIDNLSQTDAFLISPKDDELMIEGVEHVGYGYVTLMPGTTTQVRIELYSADWGSAEWLSGNLSLAFDYSPLNLSSGYYSGARYTDVIVLEHP